MAGVEGGNVTLLAGAPVSRRSISRSWGKVVVALALWIALYAVNGTFWDWVVFDVAGLDPDTRLGSATEFFVYDTTKILLLLGGIIFVVTDFPQIVAYDVMSTPALVIDEEVVLAGRVPSVDELRRLLAAVKS